MHCDKDISVIIPTYNSAKTIRRCIDSILQQQSVSFEIHAIDDLGEDKTREILQDIQKTLPAGTLHLHFRNRPLGQSTARNIGIDSSQGEYIYFLDSDDVLADPEVLKKCLETARRKNAEIVVNQYTYVTLRGKITAGNQVPIPPNGGPCSIATYPQLAHITCFWQNLYSRAFLNNNGIRFSRQLRQREDRPFLIQALTAAQLVYVTPCIGTRQYKRADSSYHQVNTDQLRQFIIHLHTIGEEFKKMQQSAIAEQLVFAASVYAISLLQLIKYWGPHLLFSKEFMEADTLSEEGRLLAELIAAYAAIDPGLMLADLPPSVHKIHCEKWYVDYDLDLLRVLAKEGAKELFMKLMKQEVLLPKDFQDCRFHDPTSMQVVAFYLAYHRTAVCKKLQESSSAFRPSFKNMTIILHVGMPKTGTSSLQNFLELNRFNLAQQGFYYPLMGSFRERGIRKYRTPGHLLLVQGILRGNREWASSLGLELAASPCPIHTVILSAENILSPVLWSGKETLESLRDAFPDANVLLYGLQREQIAWLESWYRELVGSYRNQYIKTPAECINDLTETGVLNFEYIQQCAVAVFGEKNVCLRRYEDVCAAEGIIADFSQTYGIAAKGFYEVPRELTNESVSNVDALRIFAMKKLQVPLHIMEKYIPELKQYPGTQDYPFLIEPQALHACQSSIAQAQPVDHPALHTIAGVDISTEMCFIELLPQTVTGHIIRDLVSMVNGTSDKTSDPFVEVYRTLAAGKFGRIIRFMEPVLAKIHKKWLKKT